MIACRTVADFADLVRCRMSAGIVAKPAGSGCTQKIDRAAREGTARCSYVGDDVLDIVAAPFMAGLADELPVMSGRNTPGTGPFCRGGPDPTVGLADRLRYAAECSI